MEDCAGNSNLDGTKKISGGFLRMISLTFKSFNESSAFFSDLSHISRVRAFSCGHSFSPKPYTMVWVD